MGNKVDGAVTALRVNAIIFISACALIGYVCTKLRSGFPLLALALVPRFTYKTYPTQTNTSSEEEDTYKEETPNE